MKTISIQTAHQVITSRKERIVSFQNTQTGSIFSYKVVQAEYDPIDPFSKDLPPQFIFTQIGDGEWAYMGALYQDRDYVHYEEGIFPADYPCVKIWRFVLKMMIIDRDIPHIECFEGMPEGEDQELSCEQVQNMQYGTKQFPIIAGHVSKDIANNFLKPKTRLEMHKYIKDQFEI